MDQANGALGASVDSGASNTVQCPVCSLEMPATTINSHLDTCLYPKPTGAPGKRRRLSSHEDSGSLEDVQVPGRSQGSAAPSFPLFHKHRSSDGPSELPSISSQSPKRIEPKKHSFIAPSSSDCPQKQGELQDSQSGTLQGLQKQKNLTDKLDGKPLADKMRPSCLQDYKGQNKVLGENTMLRTLLQSNDIPSILLWGPPGCGKTTLAHIIAKNTNKNNTRFVTLSATSASTNDVREVIKQAQNEIKLFKRKTILFVDEIHRFNKTQQDTFLPHVECGTITFIGATTENPSFQVNTALLSRCRVIVLEKLSVEAMEDILMRAVDSLGMKVLNEDGQPDCSSSNVSDVLGLLSSKLTRQEGNA